MSRREPIRDQRPAVARTHPVADAYLIWRLFKHALHGITGVPADASPLTALFAVGVLADAMRQVAAPSLRRVRPPRPSGANVVMAVAVAREIPGSLGGSYTRSKPFAGTLIAISLLLPVLHILRRITAPARRFPAALAALVRRYGI